MLTAKAILYLATAFTPIAIASTLATHNCPAGQVGVGVSSLCDVVNENFTQCVYNGQVYSDQCDVLSDTPDQTDYCHGDWTNNYSVTCASDGHSAVSVTDNNGKVYGNCVAQASNSFCAQAPNGFFTLEWCCST